MKKKKARKWLLELVGDFITLPAHPNPLGSFLSSVRTEASPKSLRKLQKALHVLGALSAAGQVGVVLACLPNEKST